MSRSLEIGKQMTRLFAVWGLAALLAPTLAVAQEAPRRLYSAPIGLTQADAIRVVITPAPVRIQGSERFCDIEVGVEVLDALDLSVQASFGQSRVLVGSGFQANFSAAVGAPPDRREVIVRTTIERTPRRAVEKGTVAALCPVRGSIQLFDVGSGRNLAAPLSLTDATTRNPEFVPDVAGL